MNPISFYEKPALNHPILIAGFGGWPNAGNISIETLTYLKKQLRAIKFAELDPDPFYHYTTIRPWAMVENGEVKYSPFSPYEFFYQKGKGTPDLILFIGNEPELKWKQFIHSFLQLAADLTVELLFTIGGAYDYITHNQAPLVSGVFTDENLKMKFTHTGIKLAEYQGPVSIHTMILMEAKKRGIKGISLWGHAPQYLQSNNLPVIYQILTHMRALGTFGLDLTLLHLQAIELRKQINILAQKNPEISKIIEKFERASQGKKESSLHDNVISIDAYLKKDPSNGKCSD